MWKDYFVYCADFLPLTLGTGVTYTDFDISIRNDFEIIRSMHVATSSAINLKLFDATSGRDIIRPAGDLRGVGANSLNGITANGFVPYVFPVPYFITEGTELRVSASDKSGSTNALRYTLHGNHVHHNEAAPYENRKKREPYSFAISSDSMSAYGTITKAITMDKNAGFLVSKITGVSTGTCTIFVQDTQPWSSREVHLYNMFGNSQFGNNLPSRRWIPEKGMLSVRFTDISGSTNLANIVLHGEKLYV